MENWTVDEVALDKMSMADLCAFKKYTKKKVKKLAKRVVDLNGGVGLLLEKAHEQKLYYQTLKNFIVREIEDRITHLVYK
jgi:hypothetical protein